MSIIPIIGEKVIPKGEIAIFNITENKRRTIRTGGREGG